MSVMETLNRTARIRRLLEETCRQHQSASLHIEIPTEDGGVYPGGGRVFFLEFDSTGRNPWLDLDAREAGELRHFLSPGASVDVSFSSATMDGYFRFTAEVLLWAENGTVLRLRFPNMVERMQRRVTLRVRPTADRPVFLEGEDARGGFRVAVDSLSVRGAGFRMPRQLAPRPGAILKGCRLVMPQETVVRTARINEVILAGPDEVRVSAVFLDMDGEKELRIRAYMRGLLESSVHFSKAGPALNGRPGNGG